MAENVRGTYEQEIDFTQSIRKQIIAKQTEGGVPSDPEAVKILLAALKDHDHTTLNDRKNGIDSANAQSAEDIAKAMQLMVEQNLNKNPFARERDGSITVDGDVVTDTSVLPHVDPVRLGDHTLVDGETEIGVIQESSEAFFGRMGIQVNKE